MSATLRKIALDEVHWRIIAEQDNIPVRGNALASGDDAQDRECEDEIIARLDDGDVWAWASVEVRGSWKGIEESEYLGCCSYADEDDFKVGGYYDDMRATVLERIQERAELIAREVQS